MWKLLPLDTLFKFHDLRPYQCYIISHKFELQQSAKWQRLRLQNWETNTMNEAVTGLIIDKITDYGNRWYNNVFKNELTSQSTDGRNIGRPKQRWCEQF
jgi:hypothetical protein